MLSLRKKRHVLAADVQACQERQAQGAPQGVEDDPGEANPDVTVQELLLSRSRSGVAVKSVTLDVRSVPLGRAVVDGEKQQLVWGESTPSVAEQQTSEEVRPASRSGQEVVVDGKAATDVGGTEPTWLSLPGKWLENPKNHYRSGRARVQLIPIQARDSPLRMPGESYERTGQDGQCS
jgi:hypothetical protein